MQLSFYMKWIWSNYRLFFDVYDKKNFSKSLKKKSFLL